MNTASIKLYDILVEKGVDKNTAREAVGEFITRDEAMRTLATKQDLSDLRTEIQTQFRTFTMWVAGLLIGQVAVLTGIIALMFNLYVA